MLSPRRPPPSVCPDPRRRQRQDAGSQFFGHGAAAVPEGDARWVPFLRGFNRCCARVPALCSLVLLLRVYAAACTGAGAPCGVQLQPDVGGDEDGKVIGELTPEEMAMFL